MAIGRCRTPGTRTSDCASVHADTPSKRVALAYGIIGRVNFSYALTGTGWAEAMIAGSGRVATITVSYLTEDALGDLLAAVTAALGPRGRGGCSWQEEPGEYAWSFRRVGQDVEVEVDWY